MNIITRDSCVVGGVLTFAPLVTGCSGGGGAGGGDTSLAPHPRQHQGPERAAHCRVGLSAREALIGHSLLLGDSRTGLGLGRCHPLAYDVSRSEIASTPPTIVATMRFPVK